MVQTKGDIRGINSLSYRVFQRGTPRDPKLLTQISHFLHETTRSTLDASPSPPFSVIHGPCPGRGDGSPRPHRRIHEYELHPMRDHRSENGRNGGFSLR